MTIDDLPFLDLADPAFSTRSDAVREARDAHWCARTPYGVAVLRHAQAGRLLRDRRLRQGSHAWPDYLGLEGAFADFWRRSLIGQEGAAHKALRAVAQPALSPAFIEGLEPRFTAAAERLVEGLDRRAPVEFMSAFAQPYAGCAVGILLDLDEETWVEAAADASALGLAMGVDGKRHEPVFNAACERLSALAVRLIQRARSGEDRESYAARLIAGSDAAGGLDEQALVDLIVISIFGAVDTTRAQLGLAMALFADHPEQWQALRADSSLAGAAVEEAIRSRPTTTWATRETLEAVELDGVVIPAGTTVHVLVHASARDPAVCEDSGFNITARRRNHFGFGGGAHHCLGQQVARTDIAIALRALALEVETFKIGGEVEWLPESGNTGPISLPLSLT